MQYVVDKIPEWAWESINKCRLFLKANTIADLATIDGKYILDQIKMVKAPLLYSFLSKQDQVNKMLKNGSIP